MNKVTVVALGIFLLGTSLVFAEETQMAKAPIQDSTRSAATEDQPVEVGNKICPVSGNPVGEMGPAIKHVYNGKIYNLCCGMCPGTFDKDPAKYVKIADDEVAAQKKQ
jgi:YHS domain-containing protein